MKKTISDLWLGPKTISCISTKVSRGFLLVQITHRFGQEVADETDLEKDIMTYARWHFAGFYIRPNEECIRGLRYIPAMSEGNSRTIRRPIATRLFHRAQVSKRKQLLTK